MERRRPGSPMYNRQQSVSSTGSSSGSSTVFPPMKRNQNIATKAANVRLAHVMSSQNSTEEEDDNEDEVEEEVIAHRFGAGVGSRASAGITSQDNGSLSLVRRAAKSPSPRLGRNSVEHAPAIRSSSAGRPSMASRTPLVPPIRTSVRSPSPVSTRELSIDKQKGRRIPAELKRQNSRDTGNNREVSALRDELDMLQEENTYMLEKLRFTEEKCEEAEARARELENQVAALGDGISLEARLLSRKEAALKQREAALKAISLNKDDRNDEISALRKQLETAREQAAIAEYKLRAAESEIKALRSVTERMILTEEEMEEVVLKRCWLARYWGLAAHYGVYLDIAVSKHEHWSSLAPLPLELVVSTGQKAKNETWKKDVADEDRENQADPDLNDITREGSIESMLSVEKGLKELASLKVENAIMFAMSNHRLMNFLKQSISDNKSPGDPQYMEAFELNEEEAQDVLFKQAWLTYFWRRAKNHGIEDDISEERLEFWISHIGQSPTSHDVVEVERGLQELRKLGIEEQLWEKSHRETELPRIMNKYHKSHASDNL